VCFDYEPLSYSWQSPTFALLDTSPVLVVNLHTKFESCRYSRSRDMKGVRDPGYDPLCPLILHFLVVLIVIVMNLHTKFEVYISSAITEIQRGSQHFKSRSV